MQPHSIYYITVYYKMVKTICLFSLFIHHSQSHFTSQFCSTKLCTLSQFRSSQLQKNVFCNPIHKVCFVHFLYLWRFRIDSLSHCNRTALEIDCNRTESASGRWSGCFGVNLCSISAQTQTNCTKEERVQFKCSLHCT